MKPEYVVVGHCTLDLQRDGSLLPGGTALYAALTAARLGMHVGVLTAGEPDVLREVLAPYRDAFDLVIVPSPATTTFENVPTPTGRKQTIHGVGGMILPDALPAQWRDPAVLHLGPMANELPFSAWADILDGIQWPVTTPQGWLRRWETLPSLVHHVVPSFPDTLIARLRVAVISNEEEDVAGAMIHAVATHGIGVITYGRQGATLFIGDARLDVPAFAATERDETGAGDVFAAALFASLARGEQPALAARTACAAAALSIAGPGPTAIPSAAAVQLLTGEEA